AVCGDGVARRQPASRRWYLDIHLVDIDSDAIRAGLAFQSVSRVANMHVCGGIDLTGICDRLAHWTPATPPGPGELQQCLSQLDKIARLPLPRGFSVVAATRMLTQLSRSH